MPPSMSIRPIREEILRRSSTKSTGNSNSKSTRITNRTRFKPGMKPLMNLFKKSFKMAGKSPKPTLSSLRTSPNLEEILLNLLFRIRRSLKILRFLILKRGLQMGQLKAR